MVLGAGSIGASDGGLKLGHFAAPTRRPVEVVLVMDTVGQKRKQRG
jgi:hypothetical protein